MSISSLESALETDDENKKDHVKAVLDVARVVDPLFAKAADDDAMAD